MGGFPGVLFLTNTLGFDHPRPQIPPGRVQNRDEDVLVHHNITVYPFPYARASFMSVTLTATAELRYAAQVRSFQYVQVASMAVLAYDALILFGEEIDLIWKARWTLPKALYILSRYTPFLDLAVDLYHTLAFPQPSTEACQSTYIFISWSMTIGMALSEVVMILRIYAMRGRSKRVLYSLSTLWGVLVVVGLFFSNRVAYSVTFGQLNIAGLTGWGLTGCHALPMTSFPLAAAFGSLLAMEVVIVTLTIWTAFERWNERCLFESFDLTFKTLYFDGVLFFLCLLGFSLANISFTFLTDDSAITPIFIAPMRVMHGILSCRMLLNIRRIAAKRVVLPSPAITSPSLSSSSDSDLTDATVFDLRDLDYDSGLVLGSGAEWWDDDVSVHPAKGGSGDVEPPTRVKIGRLWTTIRRRARAPWGG